MDRKSRIVVFWLADRDLRVKLVHPMGVAELPRKVGRWKILGLVHFLETVRWQ